jgi:predicted metallopeptidase
MLEVEQSVAKHVEALPLEQIQETDTVVVPNVTSGASAVAAVCIPVVSPAVTALCAPYETAALAAFATSTDA